MRQRLLWSVEWSLCLGMIVLGSALPAESLAQEPSPAPAVEPAAQPATEPAAAPAPTAAPTVAPTTETPAPPKSALLWFYKSLGLPYVIAFLPMSFILVALFITNFLASKRDNVCPRSLVDGFRALLDEQKYQEAYELAKSDESFLGQMLAVGMARVSSGGYEKAMTAMSQVGEEENMKLEHRLGYMALIGTIAPMVGLFGTVDGMIRSFIVIASTNTTPKPAELAMGISTALVTTIVGLAIAIPAMAAFNIMKNRVARLVLEVGVVSEELMSRFEGVGPTKKP